MNKHLHIKSGEEHVDIQLRSGAWENAGVPSMLEALPHLQPQQGGCQFHAEPRTLFGRIASCSIILLILLLAFGAIAWFSFMAFWDSL